MKRLGGAVLRAAFALAFHAALTWALTIAFMLALATMNIAAGSPAAGNEFIGYWICSFIATAASATPLCLWDMADPQVGRRTGFGSIRRCAAIAGAVSAFYGLNLVDPFARAASYDRFLFAYTSPAIMVLIGLLYADLSRSILTHIRVVAAIGRRRLKVGRGGGDTVTPS